jgi:hypothetical protein
LSDAAIAELLHYWYARCFLELKKTTWFEQVWTFLLPITEKWLQETALCSAGGSLLLEDARLPNAASIEILLEVDPAERARWTT